MMGTEEKRLLVLEQEITSLQARATALEATRNTSSIPSVASTLSTDFGTLQLTQSRQGPLYEQSCTGKSNPPHSLYYVNCFKDPKSASNFRTHCVSLQQIGSITTSKNCWLAVLSSRKAAISIHFLHATSSRSWFSLQSLSTRQGKINTRKQRNVSLDTLYALD